ncbi:MAG: ADOP family duplicated permease [Acidobacteriota bacterium]|nr:ADOP family duplicated permease [Acidobacteriota bacterium]
MSSLISQAWNSWKSAKGTALLATVALAIGIGSATAIYTVVDAVLLKSLPYRQGERFVAIFGVVLNEPGKKSGMGNEYLQALKEQQRSFDVFGWFTLQDDFNLTSAGEPQHARGIRVSPELARNLGVKLRAGRWFSSASDNLAVISYEFWQRLGGRNDIVGQPITLDGQSYVVSGVAPAWFNLPLFSVSGHKDQSDLWIPISPQYAKGAGNQGLFLSYARLKPGVSLTRASADLKRIAAELVREHPVELFNRSVKIEPLRASVATDIRPTLLLLLAAAGLLLLITCANVSGLLVTRAVSRARETAIRLALGAAQRQVILQYFSEGLVVSLIGAAAGVFVSYLLVRLVLSLTADYIPFADEVSLDWTAVGFAVLTALVASVLTSLAPLWQALRTAPNEVLSDGVRASASLRSRRLSQGLVIAEIAVAFTLLAASALLIAQLNNLNRLRPGFDPEHLLTFQLTVSGRQYSDDNKRIAYQKELVQALQSIPGVSSAALISHLPLDGCCYTTNLLPEGRTLSPGTVLSTSFQIASPGYLATMHIPLTAGRFLTDRDTSEKPVLVVVNQTAARRFWNRADPIGAYGRFSDTQGDRFQIIGVIGDVRNDGLSNPPIPEVYLASAVDPMIWMSVVLRSNLPERSLVPAIRQAIRRLNPIQPIFSARSMHEIAQDSLTLQRATSLLTAFFAGAALLLAALGVYGVVAYSVRQRTVEFGTRMALGAVSRDLLRLVLGNGLKMAISGLLLGGLAVYATTAILLKSSVLHSVEPLPFVYSTAAIAALALLASVYPAWRATQLTPMVAIRNEPETMWLRRVASAWRTREERGPEVSEGALLSGFVDATRRAESSGNALEAALASLCETIGAESALLLEAMPGKLLQRVAAVPAGLTIAGLESDEGFLARRLRFYSLPLPLSAADYVSWLRWAAEHRPEYVAELTALQAAKIRLAVALRTAKENIGLLLLGPPRNADEYNASARRALRTCADQLALMLENARLTDRVVEQEKLNRDLALAAEVQKRLLPEGYPATSLGEVAAFTLPARTVGGDYYDFVQVGDHSIGIALADVAGKGIAAALIMSVVQASLRILSSEENISLPNLVAKMNRFLHRSTGFNSYATFFYAQVDERERTLNYVNAGHNPPYLVRRETGEQPLEELSTGGMVIGMFAQANYEEGQIQLQTGDVLAVFTDGVTEALNSAEEEFGEERLQDLLRRFAPLPVDEMSRQIAQELKSWIGSAPQHDDMTFLLFKVN